MTTTITLENATSEFLTAFKGLAKVANVNYNISKDKTRLKKAIKAVERGKTTKCKDFEDFKKKVLG